MLSNIFNKSVKALIREIQFKFTDITTGDSSTTKHGLLPKLSGSANDVLAGDGTWAGAGAFDYVIMTSGIEPPTIMSDGFGSGLYIPFTP